MTAGQQLQANNNLLKTKLLHFMPKEGDYATGVESVTMYRRDKVGRVESCFYKPLISLMVQGSKRSTIGTEEYSYSENHCLITGVHIPGEFYFTEASTEKPCLAISMEIDRYVITELVTENQHIPKSKNTVFKGVATSEVDLDLQDAFIRLVKLLEKPTQIPVLAPMVIREIHYLLLIGPLGGSLHVINTVGTQSNQIALAINWIKDNYDKPLHIEALADKVNMAPSTFHRHFRQLTSLSPMQYQKRLRLQEAQRLMLIENKDASNAGYAVGYESVTQFYREYKRMFGQSPRRNINDRLM